MSDEARHKAARYIFRHRIHYSPPSIDAKHTSPDVRELEKELERLFTLEFEKKELLELETFRDLNTMSDSDGEYVADNNSDDDFGAHQVSSRHGTRSSGPVRGPAGSAARGGDTNAGSSRRRAKWEDIQRSWDNVIEGADGSINTAVENLREATKRKR